MSSTFIDSIIFLDNPSYILTPLDIITEYYHSLFYINAIKASLIETSQSSLDIRFLNIFHHYTQLLDILRLDRVFLVRDLLNEILHYTLFYLSFSENKDKDPLTSVEISKKILTLHDTFTKFLVTLTPDNLELIENINDLSVSFIVDKMEKFQYFYIVDFYKKMIKISDMPGLEKTILICFFTHPVKFLTDNDISVVDFFNNLNISREYEPAPISEELLLKEYDKYKTVLNIILNQLKTYHNLNSFVLSNDFETFLFKSLAIEYQYEISYDLPLHQLLNIIPVDFDFSIKKESNDNLLKFLDDYMYDKKHKRLYKRD